MPIRQLGRTVILVHNLNEAIEYYSSKLGFDIIYEDDYIAHVGPPEQRHDIMGLTGIGLWLIPASGDEERSLVGKQTGGAPTVVVYTDDCRQTYEELVSRGVHFEIEPVDRGPGNGIVAHFQDLYGNRFVLVQLKRNEE